MPELGDATLTTSSMAGYNVTVPPSTGILVPYPALGTFDPSAHTQDGTPVDTAINGSSCIAMAGHDAYPSAGISAAVWSDGLSPQTLGLVRALVQLNASYHTPAHLGLCCLLSGTSLAPGGGTQGYALLLDTILSSQRIRLVQLTDGGSFSPGGSNASSYVVLAETANDAFTVGVPVTLQLEWYVDAVQLKGVFLRASANGGLLWEIVYTGSAAYVPGVAATSRYGVLGHQVTNPVVMYVDDVEMGAGETS